MTSINKSEPTWLLIMNKVRSSSVVPAGLISDENKKCGIVFISGNFRNEKLRTTLNTVETDDDFFIYFKKYMLIQMFPFSKKHRLGLVVLVVSDSRF